jgi:hypothetical protein
MGTGIGASLVSASPGTTIASSTYNSNLTSLNNAGVSNDGGNVQTDGSGNITATGFIVGTSGHFTLGTSGTVRFSTHDVLYVESASGHTDLQLYGSGGQIRFKDASGNTVAAINPSDHSFALADGSQVLHDIVYVNTGANETYFQALGSGKIRFKDNNGNDLASLDSSGNWRTKGTQTASVTP